jgi:hypothetical protein
MQVLNRQEQALVAACVEAMLPPGGVIALSGEEAGVLAYVDQMLGRLPVVTRVMLRALLRFVEYSPWVFGPFQSRMTRLPVAERVKVIQALSESRLYVLRSAFVALRALLTLGYFGNAQVNRALGMEPACGREAA